MKVCIQGSNQTIDLTQKDYLAQGGEGVVYVKKGTAYKIYHDPAKMIPLGKLAELTAITDPVVIRPQSVLMDAKGTQVVGYTMPFIDGGYPLCQLFPRSFREREGVLPSMVADLVAKMRKSIDNVHRSGVLIVDLNEMNFLVKRTFDQVYFIDSDSYQTPHFPATAIMDSIRDWTVHHNQWSEASDWYSFAILSFQMFTGIHPFRGKYHGPKVEFKGRLVTDATDDTFAVTRRRMESNISVMHPEVGIPSSAYPMTAIPAEYRKWYEEVFVQGKRTPPPGKVGVVMAFTVPTTTTLQGTYIEFLELFAGWNPLGTITAFYPSPILGGPAVVETDGGVYLDKQIVPVPMHRAQVCAFTPKAGRAVVGLVRDGKLILSNITDRAPIPFDLAVKEASSYDGRIYVRTDEQIHEVVLTDAGSSVIASARAVTNVMPHATQLFSGVAIQSMLGATYVSLFVKSGSSHQIRIPEIDKHRVIHAKYDRDVLMVIAEQGGKYSRMVFRFDTDGTYDARIVKDIPSGYAANFVTLDSGVVCCNNEDELLELFSKVKGSSSMKIVDDKALTGDMVLGKHAGSLIAYHGTKILKLKLK